jgi:hypothetical protein
MDAKFVQIVVGVNASETFIKYAKHLIKNKNQYRKQYGRFLK